MGHPLTFATLKMNYRGTTSYSLSKNSLFKGYLIKKVKKIAIPKESIARVHREGGGCTQGKANKAIVYCNREYPIPSAAFFTHLLLSLSLEFNK